MKSECQEIFNDLNQNHPDRDLNHNQNTVIKLRFNKSHLLQEVNVQAHMPSCFLLAFSSLSKHSSDSYNCDVQRTSHF